MAEGERPGFRLSPGQRRLWRLCQESGPAPFRARCLLRLVGPLETGRLAAALRLVAERHDVLRTAFRLLPGMSLPVQVPAAPGATPLAQADLGALTPAARQAQAEALWERGGRQRAAGGAALYALLLRLAPAEHLLWLELPALLADARTLDNLAAELAAAYEPAAAGSAVEPLQYARFAQWHDDVREEEGAAGKAFWDAAQLAGVAPLVLPYGAAAAAQAAAPFRPRPLPVLALDAEPLAATARAAAASLETFCLAAWQVLLWRLTGRAELVSGRLAPGRDHELLEGALGLYSRLLPVRTSLSPRMTFGEVARQVAGWIERCAEWQEHFEPADALPPASEAAAGHFAAGFCWEDAPRLLATAAGEPTWLRERREACCERFDLLLAAASRDGVLSCELVYDRGRLGGADAGYVGRLFATLLASAAASPQAAIADLELLPAAEQAELLLAGQAPPPRAHVARDARDAEVAAGKRPLHRAFERQVRSTPQRIAVACGEEALSFAELNARANRLARYLRARGVGPEVPVGLLLPRSLDLLVALWATLKAGGAYLPLDLLAPPARLAMILEESRAPVVLCRGAWRGGNAADAADIALEEWRRLPDGLRLVDLATAGPEIARLDPADLAGVDLPDGLAYVVYTSGTTGRPKGVMVAHRPVANLAAALAEAVYRRHARGAALTVTLNAPLHFDASVKQWAQLLAGHTLHIVPEEVRADPERFTAFVRRHAVDVVDCTPSQLRGLIAAGLAGAREPAPAAVLVGGEAIDPATWRALAALEDVGPARFYNVYGPAECTVDSTVRARAGAPTRPTLGRPLANLSCRVLDPLLRPQPRGVTGELCVGGAGVSRGYLARPELTAERFVPDPHAAAPGARLYRTGDLARLLPDGELEFRGRRDNQVKVRGVRIELEEIEALLVEHPAVAQAAAALAGQPLEPDGAELAAFVALRLGAAAAATPAELRAWLRRRLPESMVPGLVVVLPELPLTAGGKVDRAALPDPRQLAAAPAQAAYVAPRNDAERKVAAIWREVLAVPAVGVNDNFFDLGGHSLLMVRAHGRLQEAFGRPISLVELFRFPTAGAVAAYLAQEADETLSLAALRERAGRQHAEQERRRQAMERARRPR